jgi:AraC-like DNA-binding protein
MIRTELYERIVAAKVYIDANYQGSIDLAAVSRHACISPFHFHRLFRTVYRRTPHQYITQKRLEKAQQLLSENMPVGEVCAEVGFESLGSFSMLFKKEIGFAPTYYRNMAWLKKKEQQSQPRKFIPHCFIEGYRL